MDEVVQPGHAKTLWSQGASHVLVVSFITMVGSRQKVLSQISLAYGVMDSLSTSIRLCKSVSQSVIHSSEPSCQHPPETVRETVDFSNLELLREGVTREA